MLLDTLLKDAGTSLDWQYIISYAILLAPAVIPGVLFVYSFIKEPRQFRNALFLFATLAWSSILLVLRLNNFILGLILVTLVLLTPFLTIGFLLINTIVVVRNNGFSLTSMLPFLMAGFLVLLIASPTIVNYFDPDARHIVVFVLGLFTLEGLWFSFTFVALLFYSWVYRLLPRRRQYDYIIIHGAGLDGPRPTPLLAGRIDKALELWNKQHQHGKFVVSGGQGADEIVSEAQAMRDYLLEKGVSADAILMEDKSTTTWENLRYSLAIINADRATGVDVTSSAAVASGAVATTASDAAASDASGTAASSGDFTTAVVTSDFHVFRCAEYAHNLGIKADGIGSHTKGWYWPTAFIREFIAITKAHLWPYLVIVGLYTLINVLNYAFFYLGVV
ncbi:MAG: YdcF family protein [Lancefieldella parvula]|uniref:YdcF family protein n=1 Tax=Lancefieldella parvula TaxID=1382 RepID=A0A9E7AN34_9ACTN|nr:MAG: YdcF family protein [Lancefieldella parvula]